MDKPLDFDITFIHPDFLTKILNSCRDASNGLETIAECFYSKKYGKRQVRVKTDTIWINPSSKGISEYLENNDLPQICAIISHEFLHILITHTTESYITSAKLDSICTKNDFLTNNGID